MTLLEDWLMVAGLLLLTLGTGAQAWANLRDFRATRQDVRDQAGNEAGNQAVNEVAEIRSLMAGIASDLTPTPALDRILGFILANSEQGVQLARYLRLAVVWAILMTGSALTLAAAVIQLVLALK